MIKPHYPKVQLRRYKIHIQQQVYFVSFHTGFKWTNNDFRPWSLPSNRTFIKKKKKCSIAWHLLLKIDRGEFVLKTYVLRFSGFICTLPFLSHLFLKHSNMSNFLQRDTFWESPPICTQFRAEDWADDHFLKRCMASVKKKVHSFISSFFFPSSVIR